VQSVPLGAELIDAVAVSVLAVLVLHVRVERMSVEDDLRGSVEDLPELRALGDVDARRAA